MIPSLPDFDNKRQRSVNNSWSSILGNMSDASSQTSIKMMLAAYIGRSVGDIPVTASRTETIYLIHKATT